jgi:hypothetical protein
MATLVIHGTMTILGAVHAKWWWNSWQQGGFLNSLAGGISAAGGLNDVWRVGGRPVREIPELKAHWSMLTGLANQLSEKEGHFLWSGADSFSDRRAGAHLLAKYINKVLEIAPGEPIRIVAHSHGCNVVKQASTDGSLDRRVRFQRVVFLACPHFVGRNNRGPVLHHRLAPARFQQILNLYSTGDTVQTTIAQGVIGPFGAHPSDFVPAVANRTEQDAAARRLYEDWSIPTADRGTAAHTAMHGMRVGYLIGRWLAGDNFQNIVNTFGSRLLPVPLGDFG